MFAPRGWLRRRVVKEMYNALKNSDLFDAQWYRSTNLPQGLSRLRDPIWHYLDVGWKLGLNPSPHFDTAYYLERNADVRAISLNPLYHYIAYGANERRPFLSTGARWASDVNFAVAPVRVFRDTTRGSHLTVMIDDNSPRHPVLGHNSLIAALASLASSSAATLRVLSRRSGRTDAPDGRTLRALALSNQQRIEFLTIGYRDSYVDVPLGAEEAIIATSWSSFHALRQSAGVGAVLYFMQACDICALPAGSAQHRAQEAIATAFGTLMVSDPLLAQHLVEAHGLPREVASALHLPLPTVTSRAARLTKATARTVSVLIAPSSGETMSEHCVELLETAMLQKVLDPDHWKIVFFGEAVPSMRLLDSVEPEMRGALTLEAYQELLGSSDVVIALDARARRSPVSRDAERAGCATVELGAAKPLSARKGKAATATASGVVDSLVSSLAGALTVAISNTSPRSRSETEGIDATLLAAVGVAIDQTVRGNRAG